MEQSAVCAICDIGLSLKPETEKFILMDDVYRAYDEECPAQMHFL